MSASNHLRFLHRLGLIVVFVVFSATFAGCPKPWPKCDGNKDCAADKKGNSAQKNFFCINGQCLECRAGKDCGPKQKCDGNKCVDKTCDDVKCSDPRKRCNSSTLKCEWICQNDGDTNCDGDRCKVCKNHQCVPKQPACTSDANCPGAHKICKNPGTCDAACETGCSSNKPCEKGFVCRGGTCERDTCKASPIYFNFNRSGIRSDARQGLKGNIACLKKMSGKKIIITGHCDERGTVEYNLQLGKRRAKRTARYLSRLGVDKSRFCLVSKGKESPAVPNASSNEDHQKNRRAEFSFADSCP